MIDNKVWWITGASSGIGAALAEVMGKRGAKLILSGRNEAALKEVAQRCGGESMLLPFDTTDFDRLPALVEQAWNWKSGVFGLVNNAGISQRSMAVDTSMDVYRRIIDVDLMAPIALTQALLPRMVEAKAGALVAVSSVAGIVGVPLRAAYSAAKAGLMAYSDSVRSETAHLGLKVLVVAPGSVRTNVSRNALDANAKTRGFSDKAIDNGMPADVAAERIVTALVEGKRELILAEGMEEQGALLRRSNPDMAFDLMAQLVANGYAKQMGAEN